MMSAWALSVQVEILNSDHQTLHRLHGEQVETGPGGGWRTLGNWNPRIFRGAWRAVLREGAGLGAGIK